MNLREPATSDMDRMRELVRSAMTASYRLSPQQIDEIVDSQFSDSRLDGTSVVLVAESEDVNTAVGVAVGEFDNDVATVRWLFVDPEHRGEGVGTELFEATVDAVRDRGAERVLAAVLDANTEGGQFFERFDYDRTDERQIELGEESLVEYVYAEPAADDERAASAKTDAGTVDYPDAELDDGELAATTDDGERVYIDRDDEESGTEAPFLAAYFDTEHTDQFGYYCANCGSLNVAIDNMDRLRCNNCGNSHASRSTESYDDSYL